jgi:anti-sigma factor RsiW
MNLAYDRFRLHAYVDGELTPDEVADFERDLGGQPDVIAEVAALRAQKTAMHARYDSLLSSRPTDRVARLAAERWTFGDHASAHGLAMAAMLLVSVIVGGAVGWVARGRAVAPDSVAANDRAPAARGAEGRLQSFVQTAALSHAVFVPEVRHPVEVQAADEAHLVAWLSKRLAAPLVVPHLGDAGWELLGGRLLPAESGPVAQFMYQDKDGRRLTLAVSRGAGASAAPSATTGEPSKAPAAATFRIAEENDNTVFYWIDNAYAYALTGKLSKSDMTALASRVYRQLDREGGAAPAPVAPAPTTH